MRRPCAAALLATMLSPPASVMAQERVAISDAALAAAERSAVTEQGRGRRRRARPPQSTTRRSWGRVVTGLALVGGGVMTARTSNRLVNDITHRNDVRDAWNAASDEMETLVSTYDRSCSRGAFSSERCLEIHFGELPTLTYALFDLSAQHAFLPQFPDVEAFASSQDEERILEWIRTKSEMESKSLWTTMLYSGVAASGVGALLATIWSDVPVLRDIDVRSTGRNLAVTTSVRW